MQYATRLSHFLLFILGETLITMFKLNLKTVRNVLCILLETQNVWFSYSFHGWDKKAHNMKNTLSKLTSNLPSKCIVELSLKLERRLGYTYSCNMILFHKLNYVIGTWSR